MSEKEDPTIEEEIALIEEETKIDIKEEVDSKEKDSEKADSKKEVSEEKVIQKDFLAIDFEVETEADFEYVE